MDTLLHDERYNGPGVSTSPDARLSDVVEQHESIVATFFKVWRRTHNEELYT